MYSNIKSVQLLVAYLKENNVANIVISAGTSHDAIARSLEEDNFFTTFSVVDERSAAFFACGLAQELESPVAICCTAGTAAINYLSAMEEAYYRQLPIVILTADKNPYYLGQKEDQMVNQLSVYDSVTKFNCTLPMIYDDKDYWYCSRLLNEAFLEINHNGTGPVHINVPIEEGMFAIGEDFTTEKLPAVSQIKRYDLMDEQINWKQIFDSLTEKKILFLCGQSYHRSKREIELLEIIFEKYNCVFAVDKLSNLHCKGSLEITKAYRRLGKENWKVWPDIIITLGGNTTLDYRFILKNKSQTTEHWLISLNGKLQDPFRKLTKIFEGSEKQFLERMAYYGNSYSKEYYGIWKGFADEWVDPNYEFSNIYAIRELMRKIPGGSNLNIANSTPVRMAQYFDLDNTIKVFCNRGIHGIDGCVSTFIGQAAVSKDTLNYLIVGDLSFFYDMNGLWNRYQGINIRIMLSNNGGAALFHFNQGTDKYPTLNENVAAEHHTTAKGWAESQGYKYLSARTKKEFDAALADFITTESDAPIMFEVFTDKAEDARIQHEMFDLNRPVYNNEQVYEEPNSVKLKQLIRSVVGDSTVERIKGIIKK